jgi:outer membrane protein TolC
LNYGRIINNVHLQDATFQQLAVTYQQTVLQAEQQVEDGLVTYLRSQQQTKLLDESVAAAEKAVKIAIIQYKVGETNFNTYALIEQNLVAQELLAAQARAQIPQGLIAVYLALGGGWEICRNDAATATPPASTAPPAAAGPLSPPESIPVPTPK